MVVPLKSSNIRPFWFTKIVLGMAYFQTHIELVRKNTFELHSKKCGHHSQMSFHHHEMEVIANWLVVQ